MRMSMPVSAGFFLFATVAVAAPPPFRHPGILNNRVELDFIRERIQAGAQPWKQAYDRLRYYGGATLTYQAKPRATVECGSYSMPDNGCSDETADAIAAYAQSLMWVFTGNETYAKNGAAILEAWAATLTEHTNTNAPLQSAWAGSEFPRAAEILRATWPGWTAGHTDRQSALYRKAFLPLWMKGSNANGNWELSMIDAMTAMSVFMDDTALFTKALGMWRARVPAYFYLTTDGPLPVNPPGPVKTKDALIKYWYNQSTFVDGLSQETCRDYGHLTGGMAAAFNAAETALQQGVDLYGEQKARLTATLEFHASFLNGKAVPAWLCGGTLNSLQANSTWEIAFNHYHNRLALDLPETGKVVAGNRPTGTSLHMAFETLTHAELGSRGLGGASTIRAAGPTRAPRAKVVFLAGNRIQVIRLGSAFGLDGAALK